MKTIRAAAGVLFAVVAIAGWTSQGVEAADPITYAQAAADVKALQAQIRDRMRSNGHLIESIDALEVQFFQVLPPADAGESASGQMRVWQEKALDLLFTASRAVRTKGRVNEREHVNRRALQALGNILTSPDLIRFRDEGAAVTLRNARLRELKDVLTTDFGRTGTKDYDVSPAMLEATFATIVRLDGLRGFEWLAEEYVHTRGGEFEEQRLIAAQKAMVSLAGVPGKKRYDFVKRMITTYAGTEANAKQATDEGRSAKAFWDAVRITTVAAINHFATAPGGGPPTDAAGLGLTTVHELHAWWREHDSPKRAPWLDPKPAK